MPSAQQSRLKLKFLLYCSWWSIIFLSPADKSPMDMINPNRTIPDPVFWHLSNTLTARELVQLKLVNRTTSWSTQRLVGRTTQRIGAYFPLRFNTLPTNKSVCGNSWKDHSGDSCQDHSWTWSGIHHSSGEIHLLPSLPLFLPFLKHHVYYKIYLPSPQGRLGIYNIFHFDCLPDCLIASSGGLSLFIDHNFRSTQLEDPIVVREGQRRNHDPI